MKPQIIKFSKIGSPNLGYISVAENSDNIPFEPKRVYWTDYSPQDATGGSHATYDVEQVIVAVSGTTTFAVDDITEVLSLPISPVMEEEEVDKIIQVINQF